MKKYIENIPQYLLWIVLGLFRLLQFPISAIFFPLAYPFRKKAYEYTKGKPGKDYKLFHPLSIANWFFTKDDADGNYYTGPYWYKKELKDKVFSEYVDEEKQDPIAKTFKQKVIYFYIAYCWCGLRNYMWNLYRLVYYDVWDENRFFMTASEKIFIKKNDKFDIRFKKIFPQAKFKDEGGNYRNNSGPMILYPTNLIYPLGKCTIEGRKMIWFENSKNKLRFQYTSVKIIPIKFVKRILIFEFFMGWNYISGAWYFHFKPMFKRLTKKAQSNYNTYRKCYKKD